MWTDCSKKDRESIYLQRPGVFKLEMQSSGAISNPETYTQSSKLKVTDMKSRCKSS